MTYELKDNQLDAPDFGDWTQKEIDYAIDDLAFRVRCRGRHWDEKYNYKLNLINEILAIEFSNQSNSDKALDIRIAISECVDKWAKAEVEETPDAYFEREEYDDADYRREVA